MKLTVNYASGMTATTAGNDSVSIDTPLVSRCNCCQFCPFTDGAIYTSLPAQIKCTLTDEFHFCDDTHCDVKEKLIPIKWIKEWFNTKMNGALPRNYELVCNWMIYDWEREHEIKSRMD